MKYSIHLKTICEDMPLVNNKKILTITNNKQVVLTVNGEYDIIIANGINCSINAETSGDAIFNILLGSNSSLKLNNIITNKSNIIRNITQEKNSTLLVNDLVISDKELKQISNTQMEENSNNKFSSLIISKGKTELVNNVIHAKNTYSEIIADNFGLENSRITFIAKNHINKNATQSQAHQKEFNLILHNTAKISALPILEINNNDVTCSHSASTGKIEDTIMFYMQSRGLNSNQAKNLIIKNKIKNILSNYEEKYHILAEEFL